MKIIVFLVMVLISTAVKASMSIKDILLKPVVNGVLATNAVAMKASDVLNQHDKTVIFVVRRSGYVYAENLLSMKWFK